MDVRAGGTDARQAGGLARVGQVEDAVRGGAVRRLVRDGGGCGGNGGNGRRAGGRRLFGVRGEGGSGRGGGRGRDVSCFCTAQGQTKKTQLATRAGVSKRRA